MIHPSAHVDPAAELGEGVTIGAFTLVHGNVRIGSGTSVGSHCLIGLPTPLADGRALDIGPGATIRSHAVIYEGSTFGERLETGHGVTLREGLTVGRNLRVGTRSDLLGRSTIGDFVRIHSGVFMSQTSTVGNFVWIYPHTVFTDDPHPPNDDCLVGPTVEDYAVIAAQCCIAPAVRIGKASLVGAASMVTKDVAPGTIVMGVPARVVGQTSMVKLRDGTGGDAYPWTRNFRRGYPDEVVRAWDLDDER